MVNWFLEVSVKTFTEERIVFATNGAGTPGYPHGIKWTLATTSLYIKWVQNE